MMLKSIVALSIAASAPAEAALLGQMFTDHAVLQRDQPVPIWGTAAPGARVVVKIAGKTATATADSAGAWQAVLPHLKAGGPYRLTASSDGQEHAIDDLLIGDVFLCSGQSNMEWPLKSADDGAAAAARIAAASLRLLTLPQIASPLPKPEFQAPVAWEVASPAVAADFSAVCLLMAEELRRTRKVPFGLIDASWGGAAIQSWLSPAALATTGDPDAVALLASFNRDPVAANGVWGKRWQDWWVRTVTTERPWAEPPGTDWRRAPDGLGNWEAWGIPELAAFNGMMWYRTSFALTPEQAAQAATLDLGEADESDQSWINGRPVGSSSSNSERAFPIGAGLLRAGENSLVVNVLDTWGPGGLHGPHERRAVRFADGTRVPLSGAWFYKPVLTSKARPPKSPWDVTAGQGMIYNAMMAPMRRYAIRAMVWYQGESNSLDGLARYQEELRALFADRRASFGASLPVLVVQLANYGKILDAPAESGWAEVREAQRRVVEADAAAGLAVTIDIGNPADIHPTNKRDVGLRLARAAEHVVYGERVPRAGPQPVGAQRIGDAIRIDFRDLSGPLTATDARGFELCADAPGSCRFATATIGASSIVLGGAGSATRIRYCWADSPVCSIRDAAVPLTPFEIPIPR